MKECFASDLIVTNFLSMEKNDDKCMVISNTTGVEELDGSKRHSIKSLNSLLYRGMGKLRHT